MRDPFKGAARRIVERVGESAVFIRKSDGARITTTAVLDKDLMLMDELGDVMSRGDAISLIMDDVGTPKTGDQVYFSDSELTYTLGRSAKDDGYVSQMWAQRDG